MIEIIVVFAMYGAGAVACWLWAQRQPASLLVAWLTVEPFLAPVIVKWQRAYLGMAADGEPGALLPDLVGEALRPGRLVIGCVAAVLAALALTGRRRLARPGFTEIAMAGFSVYLAVHIALLSPNRDHAVATLSDAIVLPFVVFVLARNLLREESARELIYRGASALGAALVLSTVVERVTATYAIQRMFGPFANQTLFGSVLIVLFFMLVATADRAESQPRTIWRGCFELSFHIIPAVLFFTLSRTTWISFAAATLAFGALSRRELFWLLPRLGRALAVSLLVVLVWGAVIVSQPSRESDAPGSRGQRARASAPLDYEGDTRAESLARELVEGRALNPRTVRYRWRAWRILLRAYPDRWLVGFGFHASPAYLADRLPTRPSRDEKAASNAHSAYLSFLFEAGLVGLIGLLAVHGSTLRLAVRAVRSAASSVRDGACLAAAAVAYMLPGIPSNAFYRPASSSLLFFALAGLVAAGLDRAVPPKAVEDGR